MSGTRQTVEPAQIVVILASLGGLAAVSTLLGGLPGGFPVPVLYLQHGAGSVHPDPMTALLRRRTLLPVVAAAPGTKLAGCGVSVVPNGCGATVDGDGLVRLQDSPPGGGGDELFASVADRYGAGATAVVLSGKLSDGTAGVRAVKRAGGRVLVQDPGTARASGMPSSAIATGCVDFVLPVERIAPALVALTVAPGGADLLAVPMPHWAQLVG